MSKEITRNLKCLVLRNGIQIWKEQDRLEDLAKKITAGGKVGFIKVDGDYVNAVDIVGIFEAETMNDYNRIKKGQWQCKNLNWHDRKEVCDCHERCRKCNEYFSGAWGGCTNKGCQTGDSIDKKKGI